MNRFHKTLISVSIICCAVLVNGFLINKYLFSQTSLQKPETGKLLIDLPKKSKAMVLYLNTNCRYCNESAPFYDRLAEKGKEKNLKLFAVFPAEEDAEGKSYLDKLGLSDIEVKPSSATDFLITGTPTIVLFDDRGEVMDFWVGKLPPEKESEVLETMLLEKQ